MYLCIMFILCILPLDAGGNFRSVFAQLGEVRSLIPEALHIMVLTATATKATRSAVCCKLGMLHPVVVLQPPNKLNIVYSVIVNPGSIEEPLNH